MAKYNRYEGGCTTVVIGKDASETGRVIVGHNEDDSDSIVMMHSVPRIKHSPGETLAFGDAPEQQIPQVPETLAYYWDEVRKPGGISFGDCYFNECGVSIVSNSCKPGRADDDELASCHIGYGIRQLLAERAVSARHGLKLCIELVEKYGYFSSRSYEIADKDECWVVQIVNGHRLAARRVPDDHVFFIPNWLTIHKIDFTDTEHRNYYWSPDLVEFAVEKGWYVPSAPGDFSDFDFAEVYTQPDDKTSCEFRTRNAWPILGFERTEQRPFSQKALRRYGVEDVKKLMRTHYEGSPDAVDPSKDANPHPKGTGLRTICSPITVESTVTEFGELPEETCVWRAWLQPCINPYVPFYIGALKAPSYFHRMNWKQAKETHFDPPVSEFEYDPSTAYWIYRTLSWMAEMDYSLASGMIRPDIKEMEDKWLQDREVLFTEAKRLRSCGRFCPENAPDAASVSAGQVSCKSAAPQAGSASVPDVTSGAEAAKQLLSEYSLKQADVACAWAKDMIRRIGDSRFSMYKSGAVAAVPAEKLYV